MDTKNTKTNKFHCMKARNGISRTSGNMLIFYGKTQAQEFPSF